MEPELRAHANLPVQPINREGLYVIIAGLGVSTLGCACVLTYSFTNHDRLKRNAEEVRRCSEASSGGSRASADQQSPTDQPDAGGVAMGDARTSNAIASAPVVAANESSVGLVTQWSAPGSRTNVPSLVRSANDTLPVVSRREASGISRGGAPTGQSYNSGFSSDTPLPAVASTTTDAVVVYSIMAANACAQATVNACAKAP